MFQAEQHALQQIHACSPGSLLVATFLHVILGPGVAAFTQVALHSANTDMAQRSA